MHRFLRLFAIVCFLLALSASSASAAERMLVGFQDDESFRIRPDRAQVLDRAAEANAGIIRATVTWSFVAKKKPANAKNPFDPGVQLPRRRRARARSADPWHGGAAHGLGDAEVGERQQKGNHMPRSVGDFSQFVYALASRYSGRYPGYPFVRYYSIWNEPNLEQFLSPQYDKKGKDVAPKLYAKLVRAAYGPIKAANPLAQVAIGETSARGRDHVVKKGGTSQATHSPGRFAELVSKLRPRVPFDAWAHHPYPTTPSQAPTQVVKWPNVTLLMLPRFESSLDRWFARKNIPVWITEYGHETKPEEKKGVSYALQAVYAKQALERVKADPHVPIFIWFVLRDDPADPWQSGLAPERHEEAGVRGLRRRGGRARRAERHRLDPGRRVRAGRADLHDRFRPVLAAGCSDRRRVPRVGAAVGGGEGITQVPLAIDGWVSVPLEFMPESGHHYDLYVTAYDPHGNRIERKLELVAT